MRLFTAVELPEDVRAAVARAATPLLAPLAGVRAVPEGNLHVTLRFLGEVPADALPPLERALTEAALASPSGRVRATGFGAFPSPSRPRVVWAGIDDPNRVIATLERAVSASVLPLGFPPEDRPYSAHVTVARIDDGRGRPRGGRRRPGRERDPSGPQRLDLPPPEPLGPEFAVRELTLFRSDLGGGPGPPVYSALARFPLAAT